MTNITNLSPGTRIRVKTKTNLILEGIVLPRYELYGSDHITIKLDNGYNVGIKISNIQEFSIIEEKEKEKTLEFVLKPPPTKKLENKTIIIGTGGTIASKVDYETGGVKPTLTVKDLLEAVPELAEITEIETEVLMNIFSEDMTPSQWSLLAKKVYNILNEDPRKGVVIAHGTDTMGLSASALSFAIEGLPRGVAFVGSQRSSDRPSSDSAFNLLAAVLYTHLGIGEVAVVMHGETGDTYALAHRGTKVRKMHTSRRDAFQSINAIPLAKIFPYQRKTVILRNDYTPITQGKMTLREKFEDKVALVKFFPSMHSDIIDYLVDKKYRGIVIEGTGLGHIANRLIPSIQRAVEEEVIVTMTSQCLFGMVNLNVYSTGRKLLQAGVLPSEDMIPETAYVKLSWLLGNYNDKNEIKKLYTRNLRGEIEERRRIDVFPRWKHE